MKAWVIDRYGGARELQLREIPRPEPGPDEVLIEVRAAALNPIDPKIHEGQLKLIRPLKFPATMGSEGAGVVVAVGRDVTRFKPGDEVFTRLQKELIGSLAEYMIAKESTVALKPGRLSFEEAAGVPLAGLTAWQALFERGGLRKGGRVFIPAGSGGVGTLAIQMAKHAGAFVATNTSTKNVDFVKSLGADQVVDYRTTDFSRVVEPVDLVLDTMGGETRNKAFGLLKPGGKMVSIVPPPTREFLRQDGARWWVQWGGALLSFGLLARARRTGTIYEFLFMRPDGIQLEEIGRLFESGVLRPVTDSVFPFAQVPAAFEKVGSGRARGKVIVTVRGS